MDVGELIEDGLRRVAEAVPEVVDGLSADELGWRPGPDTNPIGWLVWHLTRVEDDHVAAVAGTEQVWTASGWSDRFGLRLAVDDTGFGHDREQVGLVHASGELLAGYHTAVAERSASYVSSLSPDDLDQVVDRRWDPPVTLGVRLVSVVCEANQHLGQAAYVRGLLERR